MVAVIIHQLECVRVFWKIWGSIFPPFTERQADWELIGPPAECFHGGAALIWQQELLNAKESGPLEDNPIKLAEEPLLSPGPALLLVLLRSH